MFGSRQIKSWYVGLICYKVYDKMRLLNLQSEGKICYTIRLCNGTRDAMILQMVCVITRVHNIYRELLVIIMHIFVIPIS